MRVRQHCALLLLLHTWLRALDRHGVLCGIVAVRRDGGALALPDGEADWRRAGRDAGGAVVPAQPEQDPPRHQGGQPAPHRGWHGQARRLRRLGAAQHVHLAARDGDRHALLDGARGDLLAGAGGGLQLQGGRLVARHHRHRALRDVAALQEERLHLRVHDASRQRAARDPQGPGRGVRRDARLHQRGARQGPFRATECRPAARARLHLDRRGSGAGQTRGSRGPIPRRALRQARPDDVALSAL
mmetsp:Transcript_29527/g.89726  ORF Transcript_29527/g.89726 Transcript_29527/m.89726 type:complete len:244 (+) Transcript_29527:202-933(+)